MTDTTSTPSPTPVVDRQDANKALLAVAAMASAGAGLVHAAAAGTHAGDRTLVTLFAITAAAQVGWAAMAIAWPKRLTAGVGIALNGAFVLAWLASRTVGLPLVDSLREVEEVGTQDLLAAVLGVVAIGAAAISLTPAVSRRSLAPGWVAAVGVLLVLLAVPGMAADHTHAEGEGHDHGEADAAHDHTEGMNHDHESTDPSHDHTDTTDASDDDEATSTAAGAHAHGDMPDRLNHEPTEDQLDDARDLIDDTGAATAKYADVNAAVAAGYQPIGDAVTGVEHYVNVEYTANDTILDPSQPESLVYKVLPDGGREFTTVMYILPPESTMDDVPDIAGSLTMWHDHDTLCFETDSVRIAGFLVNGQCRPRGEPGTAPMLHVWVTPNKCGPFAGTDTGQMTGSCVEDFHL